MVPSPDKEKLKNLVNASGYLLQLRVEQDVRDLERENGWSVAVTEQPWRHPHSGAEGFLDLVLDRYGVHTLAVECKRPRDAQWVFLVPEGKSANVTRVRWYWEINRKRPAGDWFNLYLSPPSYESAFCVVRGSGERDVGLLERICSHLCAGIEALAWQQAQLFTNPDDPHYWFLAPVIVTTAELYVCKVEPARVSLAEGELSDPAFERVPWIRFRKTLSPLSRPTPGARNIGEASKGHERTVIVVNAAEFIPTLKQWNPNRVADESYPWTAALALPEEPAG